MVKSPPDVIFCPSISSQVTTVSPEWFTSSTAEHVRVKTLPAAAELSLPVMEMIIAVERISLKLSLRSVWLDASPVIYNHCKVRGYQS